jgi:hypothetical protein
MRSDYFSTFCEVKIATLELLQKCLTKMRENCKKGLA